MLRIVKRTPFPLPRISHNQSGNSKGVAVVSLHHMLSQVRLSNNILHSSREIVQGSLKNHGRLLRTAGLVSGRRCHHFIAVPLNFSKLSFFKVNAFFKVFLKVKLNEVN